MDRNTFNRAVAYLVANSDDYAFDTRSNDYSLTEMARLVEDEFGVEDSYDINRIVAKAYERLTEG